MPLLLRQMRCMGHRIVTISPDSLVSVEQPVLIPLLICNILFHSFPRDDMRWRGADSAAWRPGAALILLAECARPGALCSRADWVWALDLNLGNR